MTSKNVFDTLAEDFGFDSLDREKYKITIGYSIKDMMNGSKDRVCAIRVIVPENDLEDPKIKNLPKTWKIEEGELPVMVEIKEQQPKMTFLCGNGKIITL